MSHDDLFGELRGVLHEDASDEAAFARVLELCARWLTRDPETFEHVALPYVTSNLSSWRDAARVCSPSLEVDMARGLTPELRALCRRHPFRASLRDPHRSSYLLEWALGRTTRVSASPERAHLLCCALTEDLLVHWRAAIDAGGRGEHLPIDVALEASWEADARRSRRLHDALLDATPNLLGDQTALAQLAFLNALTRTLFVSASLSGERDLPSPPLHPLVDEREEPEYELPTHVGLALSCVLDTEAALRRTFLVTSDGVPFFDGEYWLANDHVRRSVARIDALIDEVARDAPDAFRSKHRPVRQRVSQQSLF